MGRLIKYEFRKDSGTYLTLFGILVVTEIYFLISFLLKSDNHMVLALVLAELGGSFGILALMISGAVSYSKEINSKYSYMTFMTPNSTYKIVGAKYLSLLTCSRTLRVQRLNKAYLLIHNHGACLF